MSTADRRLLTLRAAIALPLLLAAAGGPVHTQDPAAPTPPVELTAQQDHRRILDLLGITSLRPGPSGNPKAPNAANVDEAKATPYTTLPDPLVMKDGRKETALIDGDVAFRQHSGGHTTGPNWPAFLTFASRYLKGPRVSAPAE